MSKYTTEVRFICETSIGLQESVGYSSVNDVLKQSAPKVFNFDFPIFDEQYRLPLEIKILRHYYTREICEETVGLWKLRLEDKLNLIMPYYNQLYESELLKFNPLYDVDLIRDHKADNKGQTTMAQNSQTTGNTNRTGTETENRNNTETSNSRRNGTSNTTTSGTYESTTKNDSSTENTTKETDSANNTSWKLYSDTPQGGVQGVNNFYDDRPSVENLAYLTNATKDTGNTSSTKNTTGNSTTNGNQTVNDTSSATGETNDNEENQAKTTTAETDTKTATSTDTYTGSEEKNGKNTITNTEEYLEHVRGKQGTASYSQMLKEYRETFLNIDQMIIEELSDLFFGLW